MKKKIAILTPYSSPSACGMWTRAFSDARTLHKNGFKVKILSSNILKGTKEKLQASAMKEKIEILRFKSFFRFGSNANFWFPVFFLIKYSPDLIHTHGYRHPHSFFAVLYAILFRKKIIITPHGSFEKDTNRGIIFKIIDFLYDIFIGIWEFQIYKKIISIAKWEKPFLKKFFIKSSKVKLIFNSIDGVFFNTKLTKRKNFKNTVCFYGRLDPVKNPDLIIKIAKKLPEIKFIMMGPLQGFKVPRKLPANLTLKPEKYTLNQALRVADASDIFLFLSRRESFGKTGIEAMSRGCIVIGTSTNGALEFIKDSENGYLIPKDEDIVTFTEEKIKYIYANPEKVAKIKDRAIETAKKFKPSKTNTKLLELYTDLLNIKLKKLKKI